MHACMNDCMHVCVCACVYTVCVCVCVCVCVHKHTHTLAYPERKSSLASTLLSMITALYS